MFNKKLKLAALAVGLIGSIAATPSRAAITQLGFILDRSGSIGSGNWSTIVTGLGNAVSTLIPTGGLYEISVVSFANSATIDVNSFLVTDAASRTTLASLILTLDDGTFLGGGTDMAAGFLAMNNALFDVSNSDVMNSYVNFATDGVANDDDGAITQRNALIAAGVDNLSIEGIGAGVDTTFLQGSICSPQPCDTTSPFNFPAQGFYIGVADAQGYVDAIGNKIRVVTGQVPEPSTIALLGISLLGLGAARRRKLC